jgi:hypothetical protein
MSSPDHEATGSLACSPTLVRALWLVCLLFALLGLVLAIAGDTVIFAPWRSAAAAALLERPAFPATLEPFAALTDGILGGSIVGKWVAAAWLVRRPLAEGRRWAWWALVAGLLAWFVLDSGLSLALGAGFNVWMINLAPLVVFGGLLLPARAGTRPDAPARVAAPPSRAWAVLRWVCTGFAAFGVFVALGSHTLPFTLYQQAIADAWFHGTLPAEAWTWLRFGYGLIGATFLGHFLMLALALRHAAGQRWVLDAVASSMLAWFVVDATASAAHGAWFNVYMIDVPSLLAVALPWWLALRRR